MFEEASEGAGWLVSERLTEAASEIVSRQDQFALADGGDHTKANRESEKIAASKFDAFSGKQSYESRVHESPRSDGSAEQSKQETYLHKLQQSGDEGKIAAAEAISSMLKSVNATERKDGAKLLQLLPTKENLVCFVATRIKEASSRQALLEILSSPTQAVAATELERMLTGAQENNTGIFGVDTLLRMLTTKDERTDGEQLIKMLNDSMQKGNARLLLESSKIDGSELRIILGLCRQSDKKAAVKQVFDLLKGGAVEAAALNGLITLLSSKNAAELKSGTELCTMLGTSNRGLGCALLKHLGQKPAMVEHALDILRNPNLERAASGLANLLGSERASGAAVSMLELLASKDTRDKLDGERALRLLNSKEFSERDAVVTLFNNSTVDLESRHELLKLLEKPESRKGVHILLDHLSASRRSEREIGERFLDLVSSTPQQRKTAAEIITLMGNTDQTKQKAGNALFRHLPDSQSQRQLLDLLSSAEHAGVAKKMVEWLESPGQERQAVMALLALRGSSATGSSSRERIIDLITSPNSDETIKPNPLAEELLSLLEKPKEQAIVITLLTRLDDPDQIRKMLDIAQDKNHLSKLELLSMLSSRDSREREAAVRLLSSLTQPQAELRRNRRVEDAPFDAGSAKQLLHMLGNPKGKEIAKQILRLDETNGPKLLDLVNRDKSTGATVLKMLADPYKEAEATRMISALTPAQIKTYRELTADPANKVAAGRLLRMLDSSAAASFLSMMNSPDKFIKATAGDLLRDLNAPRYDTQIDELLSTRLPSEHTHILIRIMKDEKTRVAATAILRMVQSDDDDRARLGARSLLNMLSSNEKESKPGYRLLQMLEHKDERDTAMRVITSVSIRPAMEAVVEALDDPKRRAGTLQLISMMGKQQAGELRERDPATEVAFMLTGLDREASERLISMLGDKKTQTLAEKIIISVQAGRHADLLALIEPVKPASAREIVLATQLKAALAGEDAKCVNTLMSLTTTERTTMLNMLADPQQRAFGMTLLKNLNSTRISTLIGIMKKPENQQSVKILMRLIESEDGTKRGAVASFLDHLTPRDEFGIRQPRRTAPADNAWVSMLNKEKSQAVAEQALLLTTSPAAADNLSRMLDTAEGRTHIGRLREMSKNSEDQYKVQALLKAGSLERSGFLLKLFDDQKLNRAADAIANMLSSDDDFDSFAASRLLSLGVSKNKQERELGKKFLDMLCSDDSKEQSIATNILITLPSAPGPLKALFTNDSWKPAADNLIELISPGQTFEADSTRILEALNEVLKTPESAQARRMISLLSHPTHKYTAMRLLKQMVPDGRPR